jgi:hypothetical protein
MYREIIGDPATNRSAGPAGGAHATGVSSHSPRSQTRDTVAVSLFSIAKYIFEQPPWIEHMRYVPVGRNPPRLTIQSISLLLES